jgi:predicted nucleic acid-binding Zn ribbon protein
MAKKDNVIKMGTSATTAKSFTAEDLVDIVCESCNGRFFKQVFAFKRVPALISQSGKQEIVPIPTFRCDDCGHVNEEFMPV